MKLEKHLNNFLYLHNCIIVPGFGAFITNSVTSTFDPTTNTFFPPHKEISFNPSLTKSDGLLGNAISYAEGISFFEASKRINEQVEFWKEHLSSRKQLVLDKIGSLDLNEAEKIEFHPSNNTNYLIDSFGLIPVKAVYVLPQEEVKYKTVGLFGSGIFAVASLIPIIIGGYLYFNTPDSVKQFVDKQWSGFVIPMLEDKSETVDVKVLTLPLEETILDETTSFVEEMIIPPTTDQTDVITEDDELFTEEVAVEETKEIAIKEVKSIPKETKAKEIKSVPKEETIEEVKNVSKNYQVIAGVYAKLPQAKELRDNLLKKDYKEAEITSKVGRYYYVIFNSYDSKTEAETYARQLREFYPETWVKKR